MPASPIFNSARAWRWPGNEFEAAMKLWKRIAISTGVIVFVGAAGMVARSVIALGVFTDVKPGFSGACRTITGVVGAEDIQIDRKDGLAFLSATDRRANPPSKADGLYTLKLGDPNAQLVRLAGTPVDFHPDGLSLFRAADGSLTLMVVNHESATQSSVDIFEVVVANGAAALHETGDIESDRLISPNDLVAVGKEQFYVTNDHGSHTPLGVKLENYLMLPRANVLYFDGNVFKEAANGLMFANGINVSPDGNHLYVAETKAHRLQTFVRDPFSGKLTPDVTFTLPAGPDNIDIDTKGDLWVAAHPKLLDIGTFMSDPSKPSPSEIFRLPVKAGEPQYAQQIYADLGHQIGAASVGATGNGHLLIGTYLDSKILDCTPR
jgi:arylesterase/paraoxonase